MNQSALFEGFRSPPTDSTQIPFWFLNGPVDGDEYARQLEEMAAHGVRQAMPHPRFGMDRRDYLTERYWQAFDYLLDRARAIGSKIHLYDEFNWPSGSAGGQVTIDPTHRAMGLGMRSQVAEGPQRVRFGDWTAGLKGWGSFQSICSVFLSPLRSDGSLDLAGSIRVPPPYDHQQGLDEVHINVPPGQWRVMVFFLIRTDHPSALQLGNGGIIDYLGAAPVERFIELTHEQYAARFQKHFGSIVPSIFCDEYGVFAAGPFTWTSDLPEQFRARHGYDLLDRLPLLFFDGGDLSEQTRCHYWETVSALFVERFVGRLADWCTEHGLALTGHCFEESRLFMTSANLYQALRRQHWVGMDALFESRPFHRMKIPASVQHVTDRAELLCEALGLAGGWECSPRMLRAGYTLLATVGVTHSVPHGFFQTIDNPKVECPPSFFEHNPYWKYYDIIANLNARQCWMNAQGWPVIGVAVFYPLVSWWGDSTGGRGNGYPWEVGSWPDCPARSDCEAFDRIIDGLMANQLDHDVLDDVALHEARIEEGQLRLARQQYQILIIPPMRTIRLRDLRRIVDYARHGGRVLVVGKWPQVTVEHGRDDRQLLELIEELRPLARFAASTEEVPVMVRAWTDPDVTVLDVPAPGLVVSHRRDAAHDWYLLFNRDAHECNLRLRLSAKGTVTRWDAETGTACAVECREVEGGTEVQVRLESEESTYLVFGTLDETPQSPSPRQSGVPARVQAVEGPWQFLPVPLELDTQWRADVSEQVLAVPVFRTLQVDHEPPGGPQVDWGRWYRPDFDDAGWEVVHAARGPLLYGHGGSRLFRAAIPATAKALRFPLPVEGEFALYVNGQRLQVMRSHQDPAPYWFELPTMPSSGGLLAIEVGSMAADFGLTAPLEFLCQATALPLGSWTQHGLGWYSGRAVYKTTIHLPQAPDRETTLNLGDVRECAEIWINGQLAGVRIWPPYRVAVSSLLRAGENEIAVVVSNLLANRHAWDVLGARGGGKVLPSGLLGPVTLES